MPVNPSSTHFPSRYNTTTYRYPKIYILIFLIKKSKSEFPDNLRCRATVVRARRVPGVGVVRNSTPLVV